MPVTYTTSTACAVKDRYRQLLTLLVVSLAFVGCDSNEADQSNEAPVAAINASATAPDLGEDVTLDGTGSSDPDGDNLTFTWALDGPPGSTATLSDPTAPVSSFTPDVEGMYSVALMVSDGRAEDTDEMTLAVMACPPELIESNIQVDTVYPDVCSDDDAFDYIVTGPIDVNASATFEAGIRVGFQEEAGLRVNNDGALLAHGTQEETILMTGLDDTPSFWRGLYFRSENRTSELQFVTIEYAGNDERWTDETAVVALGNDAPLAMTDVTIRESAGYGVYVLPRGTLSTLERVTHEWPSEGPFDSPLRIPDVQMGALSNTSVLGHADDVYIEVYATNSINDDLEISLSNLTLRMNGLFQVNALMTIEPGVQIEFDPDSEMRINDGGQLVAEGTEESPIVMTSTTGESEPGRWRGILFQSADLTSRMRYVRIDRGGSEAWLEFDVPATVAVDNEARLILQHSTIEAISDTSTYALAVNPRGEVPGFESNVIKARFDLPPVNGVSGAMHVPDKQLGFLDEDSELDGRVVVYATEGIQEPVTVSADGPYVMEGIFDVNALLSISPDVTFFFTEGSGMRVNDGGAILAGERFASRRVDFWSFSTERRWLGILFRAEDRTSELHWVWIRDAGRGPWPGVEAAANISVRNSRLNLTNSFITDSAGWGVFLQGDDRVVFNESNNEYRDNALGDIGGDD